MQREKVRVVVASEHPQVRDFLIGLIEQGDRAVIVGQAANASGALTLVRNLRPDVTIMDCYLPHAVGLDTIPLTRISGLDTAQTISEEIPDTRVILLNNLAAGMLPARSLSSDAAAMYSIKSNGNNISFELLDLPYEVLPPKAPVFASVEVKARTANKEENNQITDGAIAFGAVSVGGGLYLIGTLWLAPYGALLLLAGVVALGFGLVRRVAVRLWHKKR